MFPRSQQRFTISIVQAASAIAAQWTLSDEKLLVSFLDGHSSASGDGGNFKIASFQVAAVILEAAWTTGGPKTAKTCQNKWVVVCPLHLTFSSILIAFIAMLCVPCHPGHHQPHWMELV